MTYDSPKLARSLLAGIPIKGQSNSKLPHLSYNSILGSEPLKIERKQQEHLGSSVASYMELITVCQMND